MEAVFGFTGSPDRRLVDSMTDLLRHRGRPGASVAIHETPGATLAYLPAPAEHRGAVHSPGLTVSDGECLALAGIVTGTGVRADGLGERCSWRDRISGFRGAFVAAWTEGARVVLARDGAGRRTIYAARLGDRWVFAVEPKGLHRLPGFRRVLRPGAVAQYLTFSFVPGRQTMLEGLFEVPAGHLAVLSPGMGEPEFVPWHRPELDAPETSDEAVPWVERFRDLFRGAVRELDPGDGRVAVFLSGGIDSSIVTAEVADRARERGDVHTFAVHFGAKYPNEIAFAREVAERCGTRHHEVLVRPKDFVPRLRRVVWHLDEPIGDPVAMPNFELAAHVAGEGFRFVYNGEGGDPLFGGPKNMPMLLGHWYGGEFTPGFRERAYLASYRRAYEEIDRLLTPEFRRLIDVERDLEGVLTPFLEAARPVRFLDKLVNLNVRLKGAHLILPKVERMLAAWGLTPLSPLFDERLIELAYALPGRLRLRHGVEKIILKEACAGRLPDSVIRRPKSGMRVPVHYWFQGEMKRYARSLLSRRRLEADGIFRPERVRQILNYDTCEGPGRHGLRLWMLVTFQIWMDEVLR